MYIYTLTDPRDNIIKYIGKTKDIKKRLKRHINESNSNSKKDNWINKLKSENLEPIIELLDIGDESNINNLEIFWISQFLTWGFDLKNTTNGGDGGWDNLKHTEDSKYKMRNNNPNMKTVVLFDRNMNPLKKFKSLREASRQTGLERSFILRSCTKNTTVCNCYFKHVNIDFIECENWNNFLIKREYNKIYNLYTDEYWINTFSECKSYNEVVEKLNLYNYDNFKNRLYEIVKKLKINTDHFTRKLIIKNNKNEK